MFKNPKLQGCCPVFGLTGRHANARCTDGPRAWTGVDWLKLSQLSHGCQCPIKLAEALNSYKTKGQLWPSKGCMQTLLISQIQAL